MDECLGPFLVRLVEISLGSFGSHLQEFLLQFLHFLGDLLKML